MNINNIKEFYGFVQQINLSSNPKINSFIDSVNDYNRTCSCRPNEKGIKYKNCNDLYVSIVTSEIEPLKNIIFEKITDNDVVFCSENKAILTLTR